MDGNHQMSMIWLIFSSNCAWLSFSLHRSFLTRKTIRRQIRGVTTWCTCWTQIGWRLLLCGLMQCYCYLLPFHKIKYHNVVFIFFLSIYWVQLHMTSSYGNPSLHMTCQGYCIWSLIKMNKQFAHPWHKNIKISVTSKCRVALHFVFISLQIIWFIFYSWC